MIKTIELINFQPHQNTKVDLHESINVIQGLSDSGKSAFLRGIDAVLRKAPFYLTFDKDSGKNTIIFGNDDVISRSFTKTKIHKCPNCKEKVTPEMQVCEACGEFLTATSSDEFYMLNDERRDRFGKKLPEFITDFTRIKPIQFLDNEIFLNFAEQHEPMFFVSDLYTGSLRNKMISTLIPDSEKIDVLIKELTSEKLNTSAQLKVYTKQQIVAEEQLLMIGSDVADLTEAYKSIQKQSNDIELAEYNLSELVRLETELKRVSPIANLCPFIEKVKAKIDLAFNVINRCQNSEIAVKTLTNIENQLQSLSKYDKIDIMEFVQFESIQDNIVEICDLSTKLAGIISISQKLHNIKTVEIPKLPTVEFPSGLVLKLDVLECLETNYNTLNKRISDNKKDKSAILKEIEALQKELDSDKMICPITNQKYCESCIEALKNDFNT